MNRSRPKKAASPPAPRSEPAALVAERPKSEIAAWLQGFLADAGFLAKYPYYAAILGKMVPVADPSVKRMAVSLFEGQFFLHVNVDSFLREPDTLRGVLLHEVHHVALGHLTRTVFDECEEPELMDIAVEMSANEYIEEPLPNPITWRAYSAFGVRAGQSTLDRYEALVAHARTTGSRPRPQASTGERGEVAKTLDDHRYFGPGKKQPGAAGQNALLLDRAIRETNVPEPDPRHVPVAGVPRSRAHLIAGKSPGKLLEELTGTTRDPDSYVDWKTALAMFVARARAPAHTWSRPSRRFPDRPFETPGRTYRPRRADEPCLLAAIDTSLSMTRLELEEVARHLSLVNERARLVVAECDVEVNRVYPFSGAIGEVSGRGGTDLRPVFEPAVLGAHGVDGVIYFTDGDGPYPENPPPVPTLWVLTKPQHFHCPWGDRAHLGLRANR